MSYTFVVATSILFVCGHCSCDLYVNTVAGTNSTACGTAASPCKTLQMALDRATTNTVLCLVGNLSCGTEITKSMTLQGMGHAEFDCAGGGPALVVKIDSNGTAGLMISSLVFNNSNQGMYLYQPVPRPCLDKGYNGGEQYQSCKKLIEWYGKADICRDIASDCMKSCDLCPAVPELPTRFNISVSNSIFSNCSTGVVIDLPHGSSNNIDITNSSFVNSKSGAVSIGIPSNASGNTLAVTNVSMENCTGAHAGGLDIRVGTSASDGTNTNNTITITNVACTNCQSVTPCRCYRCDDKGAQGGYCQSCQTCGPPGNVSCPASSSGGCFSRNALDPIGSATSCKCSTLQALSAGGMLVAFNSPDSNKDNTVVVKDVSCTRCRSGAILTGGGPGSGGLLVAYSGGAAPQLNQNNHVTIDRFYGENCSASIPAQQGAGGLTVSYSGGGSATNHGNKVALKNSACINCSASSVGPGAGGFMFQFDAETTAENTYNDLQIINTTCKDCFGGKPGGYFALFNTGSINHHNQFSMSNVSCLTCIASDTLDNAVAEHLNGAGGLLLVHQSTSQYTGLNYNNSDQIVGWRCEWCVGGFRGAAGIVTVTIAVNNTGNQHYMENSLCKHCYTPIAGTAGAGGAKFMLGTGHTDLQSVNQQNRFDLRNLSCVFCSGGLRTRADQNAPAAGGFVVFFTAVFNHLNTVEIHGMHLDSCSGGLHLPDAAGSGGLTVSFTAFQIVSKATASNIQAQLSFANVNNLVKIRDWSCVNCTGGNSNGMAGAGGLGLSWATTGLNTGNTVSTARVRCDSCRGGNDNERAGAGGVLVAYIANYASINQLVEIDQIELVNCTGGHTKYGGSGLVIAYSEAHQTAQNVHTITRAHVTSCTGGSGALAILALRGGATSSMMPNGPGVLGFKVGLSHSSFQNCSCSGDNVVLGSTGNAGAVFISMLPWTTNNLTVESVEFHNNTVDCIGTSCSGGGLQITEMDSVVIDRSVFAGNRAFGGGALAVNPLTANTIISNTVFEENDATYQARTLDVGNLQMSNTTISTNRKGFKSTSEVVLSGQSSFGGVNVLCNKVGQYLRSTTGDSYTVLTCHGCSYGNLSLTTGWWRDGEAMRGCLVCPSPVGAFSCHGGTHVDVHQGYSKRSQGDSYLPVQCPRARSCPGNHILEPLCAKGYTGEAVGCAQCMSGYGRSDDPFICSECPVGGHATLSAMLTIAMQVIVPTMSVFSACKAHKDMSQYAPVLKVFLAYGTVSATITTAPWQLGSTMQHVLSPSTVATGTPPLLGSIFDCIYSTKNATTMHRTLFLLCVPVATGLVWALLAVVAGAMRRSLTASGDQNDERGPLENAKESTSTPYWIRHNVEFVYLVMGYLLAPIVFAYAYVGLACYSSDTTNVEFLAYDTTRPCDWSAEYVFSLSLVSVSILMMYMVFRLLQKHCLRLRVTQHDDANGDTGNPEQHARRGSDKCAAVLEDRAYIQVAFLVKGYKYKFWYWEVTVMVRKALVLSIQVAQPASLNRPLRPMMLLFIVVAALCMQLAAMPTTDSAINKLETCSLAVNAASLLLATYVSQEAMM